MRSGIIPETIGPIRRGGPAGSRSFSCRRRRNDDRVIGIHFQNGFGVSGAVGIKPVNRSSHWVKGHVSYLRAVIGSRFRAGLLKSR